MYLETDAPRLPFEDEAKESVASDIPPLAVDVAKRALILVDVVEYFNKASQARGVTKVASNKSSDFTRRYSSNAPQVQKGIKGKADQKVEQFFEATEALAATDLQRAHGFDEADIAANRVSVQAELNAKLGIGKATAEQRHEAVTKAKRGAGLLPLQP